MRKLGLMSLILLSAFCIFVGAAKADQEGNGRGDDRGSEIESETKK